MSEPPPEESPPPEPPEAAPRLPPLAELHAECDRLSAAIRAHLGDRYDDL